MLSGSVILKETYIVVVHSNLIIFIAMLATYDLLYSILSRESVT